MRRLLEYERLQSWVVRERLLTNLTTRNEGLGAAKSLASDEFGNFLEKEKGE